MTEVDFGFTPARVFVEVYDHKYDMEEVREKVLQVLKSEPEERIADLKIYVKPEDNKAYYTAAGGEISGGVDI